MLRNLLVAFLAMSLCGCIPEPFRKSLTDVEAMFNADPAAYERLIEILLDVDVGEHRLIYPQDVPDGRPGGPRFRHASVYDDPTGAAGIDLTLHEYGLSVSGRTVGLAFFDRGGPTDRGDEDVLRVFETCEAAEAWYEEEQLSLQVAFCPLAPGWYAFQVST